MVSLFPSFQYIEADGRHCLHHGTTIKSMRIVHPPSRKICFPAKCSRWYFLFSMRHGWNKNLVAQIWQLKRVQPFPHYYTCRVPALFPLSGSARRFSSFLMGDPGFAKQQHLPAQGFLIGGIRQGHLSIQLNKSLGSSLAPHQREGKHST